MLKIALINQRYGLEINGGSEYYTRLIAERLAKSGKYAVEALTTCALDYVNWKNHYKPGVEEINGVTVRRFPSKKERGDKFHQLTGYIIQKRKSGDIALNEYEKWIDLQGPFAPGLVDYVAKRRGDYDVFIVVTYLYYTAVRTLPLVADKAIMIPTAHNEPTVYYPIFKRMFGADPDYKPPRHFIFLTDEERDLAHALFHNEHIPFTTAGVGVDKPGTGDPDAFRKKYKLEDEYIMYVGRIDRNKGCGILIDYFMEYKKRNNNKLKLVFMGKSIMKAPEHKDMLNLGFVSEEDKFNGLSGAKASCLPSQFESLSISALESMSVGTPVIVNGQCDVLSGHCRKSDAGFYYNNYFEFEGVLNYMMSHDAEYRCMQANAKRYVEERYRWDDIMRKFDEAIDMIAGKDDSEKELKALSGWN
ncbi:MAG: glycosyltransferase family 4 protein [Treponema sp.]|jgi:glycosyltransferase involved in cell wall biosynthesis|nr:glycosyltransferase family 4 protein [Treponema sp.]